MLWKNWFMLLAVRISSNGEARVAFGCQPRAGLHFFRALQTSRVHPLLDIRTLSMNQFLNTTQDVGRTREEFVNQELQASDLHPKWFINL